MQALARAFLFAFLSVSPQVLWAQEVDRSDSENDLSGRLVGALQPFIEDRTVAGLVAIVADSSGILGQAVLGLSDVAASKAMQADDIFWIASMTKPITGVCILKLAEEGKLSLSDSIAQHLPAMKNLTTLDGQGVDISVEHLLTHTSGMAELPPHFAYSDRSLAEATARYSQLQVQFTPGSQWRYSQTSINVAARIVERVSGVTFDEFVQQRICQPLEMTDTTFYLTEDQLKRLAKSYDTVDVGLRETSIRLLNGRSPTSRDFFPAANAGLFSTAKDYVRFCRMLLRNGELDGQRILSAESVTQLRKPRTGSLQTGFTPGNAWGIGVCVVREPQGVTASLSPGSFGHGGAYGTQAWIDPEKDRAYVLMVQRANFPNSDASDLRKAFQEAAD